ncbi:hypothetical protein HanRHA438_Chr05g0222661 [Helianthus annuus]|nr:hypothetical protein HanIR_Chr05g0229571 [Helianthus annuus]KAJ0918840.1 hypothetical protein HanRHA438_Chr05g0222661 [Helianthus annuus]
MSIWCQVAVFTGKTPVNTGTVSNRYIRYRYQFFPYFGTGTFRSTGTGLVPNGYHAHP